MMIIVTAFFIYPSENCQCIQNLHVILVIAEWFENFSVRNDQYSWIDT